MRTLPLLFALLAATAAAAQQPAESPFHELKWRPVGPMRGGRTKAACGVPDQPNVFYIGAVNGGVWKTTDFGHTWKPIFDDQPTGSIGAIAVAPSNPQIVYVGSGEGLQRPDLSTGDGVYRSADGGRTWTHSAALRDGQQIPQIAVDPRDPDRLFVAVLGHPYGPNEERGIFRSTDGGKSFQKVLYRDADTGGADVVIDPAHPDTVYASLWEARQAPWENGDFSGPGSGLYKSTDGGNTWKRIGKGLPTYESDELGRIGIGLAPSLTSRVFVTVAAKKTGGLYRSDDAGESFSRITSDERVAERADDFAEVKVDPRNPDVVFTAAVVVWKSTDGGKTFAAFRGAPGGDDYQKLWINPKNPDVMLIASDQGAIVTVNGGQSFGSWYNQPTAQMFHVSADNAFPYHLCGGQQDSGSACVASRGNDGAITVRDWHPAGVEEYGYAVPDPLNPDLIYGGRITRTDRRTGQVENLSPAPLHGPEYRVIRTQPIAFSPQDPHTLYFGSSVLWKTTDAGAHWAQISPDLTRKTWAPPKSVGKYAATPAAKDWQQRGVVYAVAPSFKDRNVLWAGTDDGLIHRTQDGGKHWTDVTPKQLAPWMKVSILEAGHSDSLTAYAAINTLRLDDLRPHLLRTHDGGKTWTEIVQGLPDGAPVDVVREDPRRKGLLYAGTERQVWVSFDDGNQWQSLRLNMPATSIRDLIVKDDDLAVATHGRGFWILDDVTPLREWEPSIAASAAHLFRPATATRVRWNTNPDTPFPPDEPVSPNPPDGAILDYFVGAPGVVTIEITDAAGKPVRTVSSLDPTAALTDEGNIPHWWPRPARPPSGAPGLHRYVWDLHYDPPPAETSYPISAIPGDTPKEPRGAWALPGRYTVTLTAGGETLTQPLVVKLDPRVKPAPGALEQQLALSLRVSAALERTAEALRAVKQRKGQKADPALDALLGAAGEEPDLNRAPKAQPPSLSRSSAGLSEALVLLESADAAPSPALVKSIEALLRETDEVLAKWVKLKG